MFTNREPIAATAAMVAATGAIRFAPLRVAGAVAHLAAIGLVGAAVVAVFVALLAISIALAPILGVGLVPFAALAHTMYGAAWFETARADGLYGLGIPPLTRPPRERDGLGGSCGCSCGR